MAAEPVPAGLPAGPRPGQAPRPRPGLGVAGNGVPGPAAAPGLGQAAGPKRRRRVLQQFKSLELDKLDEALELVRASQRCVSQARSLQGLHECHRREREADWQQRERFHARIEALRLQYGLDRHGGPPGPGRGGEGRPPFGGGRQPPRGFGDPGFR